MASVSLAEARAYLGIDGADHDVYLVGMRRDAERYVRRLTIIGDSLNEAGDDYAYLFPGDLQTAQLLITKWMFDRRQEPNDAKGPPSIIGNIVGYERGEGNPNEKPLRVYVPSEPAAPPLPPTFYVGWLNATADTMLTDAVLASNGVRYTEGTDPVIPDRPVGSVGDLRQFFAIPIGHIEPVDVLIDFGAFTSIGGIGGYNIGAGPITDPDGDDYYPVVSEHPLFVDALAGRQTRLVFP